MLSAGELFVPAGYRPRACRIQVLLHLHGSPSLMERHLVASQWDAVLVTVSLKGLSNVYRQQFTRPEVFAAILSETRNEVAEIVHESEVAIGHVAISSFSAGFGGVRELLKHDECYERIDTLIMADSIYSGYSGDPLERKVDPGLMAGFLRFARDAVARKKQMVVSHCELEPEGYASTAETADYLIKELGLQRVRVSETWAERWKCTSRCTQGKFQVVGFAGTEGADHLFHLQHLDKLLHQGLLDEAAR